MPRMPLILLFVWTAILSSPCFALGWFGEDLNGRPCTGKSQGYGPFDYTDPKNASEHLFLVEKAHFTPEVQQLIKGHSGRLPEDLDYTLRAFPNHHRALYAVSRYAMQKRMEPLITPAECYFQRALVFKPDDAVTHMLFGIYLQRKHKYEMALKQYKESERIDPHSAETHYNTGLLYFAMKRYDDSLAEAKQAYAKGFPLPGLKNMLQNVGKWEKPKKSK